MTVKSSLRDIPILGGLIGSLWGGKSNEEQDYQRELENAQAQVEEYRPQFQDMQERALENQQGALSGWNQMLADVYGQQYVPTMNTMSPVEQVRDAQPNPVAPPQSQEEADAYAQEQIRKALNYQRR